MERAGGVVERGGEGRAAGPSAGGEVDRRGAARKRCPEGAAEGGGGEEEEEGDGVEEGEGEEEEEEEGREGEAKAVGEWRNSTRLLTHSGSVRFSYELESDIESQRRTPTFTAGRSSQM